MSELATSHKEMVTSAESAMLRGQIPPGFEALTAKDFPLLHTFAPGVYVRQIFMKAGQIVLGHEHKTEHVNIVVSGRCRVQMDDGGFEEIVAPCTFVSLPGVRKALHIEEDCIWITIHPTKETDLAKLEAELIVKSPAFLEHEAKGIE